MEGWHHAGCAALASIAMPAPALAPASQNASQRSRSLLPRALPPPLPQVGRDPRPVMRAAYDCFRSGASPDAIQAAAGSDTQGHASFYSSLYVGLWHEAESNTAEAQAAITRVCWLRGRAARQRVAGRAPGLPARLPAFLPLALLAHGGHSTRRDACHASAPCTHACRRCKPSTLGNLATTWLPLRACTASGVGGSFKKSLKKMQSGAQA